MRIIVYLLVSCNINFLFVSCGDNKKVGDQPTPNIVEKLLIPKLASNLSELLSISIKNQDFTVNIVSKQGIWQIDCPYEAQASGVMLNQALFELIHTSRGQHVSLAPCDYKELLLQTPKEAQDGKSGTEITLTFRDSSDPFTMILGSFQLGENSEGTQMFGELSTARRYIRILNSDQVYLIHSSLNSFNPKPEFWECTQFPPIHRLGSLTITQRDGFSWTAAKSSSYSPVTLAAEFSNHSSPLSLVKVFREFFSNGYHDGVVQEPKESNNQDVCHPLYTIKAKDRFGGNYTVEVIGNLYKKNNHFEQFDLKKGILSYGTLDKEYPKYKVCRLNIEINDMDEKQKNMVSSIRSREILFSSGIFDEIENVTNELRKISEKY